MKKIAAVAVLVTFVLGCTHSATTSNSQQAGIANARRSLASDDPNSVQALNNGQLWDAQDPSLKRGDLTIWKLQQMAQAKKYDELNRLFNSGVSLSAVPVGYAAGAGARVLDLPTELGLTALDTLTGSNWRGKIFFKSANPRESHGLNRIKQQLIGFSEPIVPMEAFTTSLLDQHILAPEVTSNFVVLNYAHPKTRPYWQEIVLTEVQVYDVMVAVPGKFGPVYVGKTWLGHYGKNDEFHAFETSTLIAWYFLDFNQEALVDQQANHWDGAKETLVDFTR